ncbi:MJ1477/TM1410 family putative glycoside hydrolase [Maridesulfovibrio sp.]|uniref:MJ1477/TM1410 family putative glycoside hydrolase n=1 Tax=Maridesulfovibrio sp. TaxID=2795000 RepID=UPI002A18E2F6|nr:MJ1477/TM1410 family putative glycoside hydrolase [Maridesulfovibrio sp.]
MKFKFSLSIILLFLIMSCSPQKPVPDRTEYGSESINGIRVTPKRPEISSWACVLQNPSTAAIAESPYQLIVTDYSKDGTDNRKFTAEEVAIMHRYKKTVLCYFSIGEAENYRFYWDKGWDENHPTFLGPENKDWPGNFKVRYWSEDWWEKALKPYMDRILEAGFDGVYLDIVDAYWFWHEQGEDVKDTADRMIKLIVRIADYCRKRAGSNFIICPQNGMGVFESCSPEYREAYFKTIDMVGLESLLFNCFSTDDRDYRLRLAGEVAKNGKTVLDMEYIGPKEYHDYLKQVRALPFKLIPYASTPDAALTRLTDFYYSLK